MGVSSRTIIRMLDDGRLRRVESKVDVRSIYQYIEHPKQSDFNARYEKKHAVKINNRIDFFAASSQRNT